jgi:hypothetical protein
MSKQYKNGQDLINYYSNHYLAGDDAKDFMDAMSKAFSEDAHKGLLGDITKRLELHNKVIEQLNKQIALDTNERNLLLPPQPKQVLPNENPKPPIDTSPLASLLTAPGSFSTRGSQYGE